LYSAAYASRPGASVVRSSSASGCVGLAPVLPTTSRTT